MIPASATRAGGDRGDGSAREGRARAVLARAYAATASLTLSFVLMVAIGALVAIRALVAQKHADLAEANAVIRWLTGLAPEDPGALLWPTVAAAVAFVANLSASSVEMTRKALATRRLLAATRPRERLAAALLRAELAGPDDAADRVERALRARGWRVRREAGEGEVALSAARRRAGHWTTLAFHLSFYVILAGALLSVLTRHSGYFELAPGERFVERGEDAYLRRSAEPLLFAGYDGFRLELDRMDLAFWPEGGIRDRASWVRVFDAAGTLRLDERLAVNSPLALDGVSIYQAGKEGFIAGITVTDSQGTAGKGTIHFAFPERPGDPMRSRARLPGTPVLLGLELRTGMLSQLTGEIAPTVDGSLSFMKVWAQEGPHARYLGAVVGGGELRFDGLTLTFDSLKPYMSFAVVRDRGVAFIFAGLALALAALVALYFWVPESVWAVVTREGAGTRVVIAGATDRYQNSFAARFRELAGELQRALSEG